MLVLIVFAGVAINKLGMLRENTVPIITRRYFVKYDLKDVLKCIEIETWAHHCGLQTATIWHHKPPQIIAVIALEGIKDSERQL